MENTNPNAAGEAAIAPVTPAKKRQAKKLAIIPMLDGYTPIAANTPKKTVLTTAYDFAADYPFRAVITAARILRTGRGTDYIGRLGFISRIAVFSAPYTASAFFGSSLRYCAAQLLGSPSSEQICSSLLPSLVPTEKCSSKSAIISSRSSAGKTPSRL